MKASRLPFGEGFRSISLNCLLFLLIFPAAFAQTNPTPPEPSPDDRYVLGPMSQPQTGVPQGTITAFTLRDSKIYPGYAHKWWLYVPAQYDGKRPIALMVFQDGGGFVERDGSWRVPVVLDNLIARKELPVMAAVFVDPGEATENRELASVERSFEYDTLSDQYISFLVREILPLAARHVRISADPNARAIAGASSGGICGFTAAWNRPDQFRKVFSAFGSFVNIRGGGAYPDLIRQSAKKPLRIFLQDGVRDELGGPYVGLNWPEANRTMAAALGSRNYDYQLVMGVGTHNSNHAASIFPDAMRWLWRDYPR
jgi:enterochelin esterase-like enzyme